MPEKSQEDTEMAAMSMLVAVGVAVSMAPAPPPPKCNPETHVPAEYAIKEGDVPLIFLPQNDVRSRALPN